MIELQAIAFFASCVFVTMILIVDAIWGEKDK